MIESLELITKANPLRNRETQTGILERDPLTAAWNVDGDRSRPTGFPSAVIVWM